MTKDEREAFYKRYERTLEERGHLPKRSMKGRYNRAKQAAKRKGAGWTLSLRAYRTLIFPDKCHYCYGELPKDGSALDRKQSKLGYTIDNVVPCCKLCNWIKSDKLSYDEMCLISQLRRDPTLQMAIFDIVLSGKDSHTV